MPWSTASISILHFGNCAHSLHPEMRLIEADELKLPGLKPLTSSRLLTSS